MERKQWLVHRIEYLIQSYYDELQSCKERFDSFYKNHLSSIQTWINSILSAIGIVVTIATLIAGLGQINFPTFDISSLTLIGTLISLGFVGLGLVAMLTVLIISKYLSYSYLSKISDAYLNAMGRLLSLKGLFAESSFNINSITMSQFYAISRFLIILGGDRFELSEVYEKASESKLFSRNKEDICILEPTRSMPE